MESNKKIVVSDLIEREEELGAILSVINDPNREAGKIILVSGEAGIGKTTLLETVQKNISSSTHVQWMGCDPLFNGRPLGPLYDLRGNLGTIAQRLLASNANQSELFNAIFDGLVDSNGTTLLVLEDAHWADHATIDFIKYLARRVVFAPCVLSITYRSDEVSPNHALYSALEVLPSAHTNRFQLQPLSPSGVAELASEQGRTDSNLHAITQGNPFFVTELLADSAGDDAQLPQSIQEAVNARLNRLSGSQREFLELISFIPGGVYSDLIQVLLPDTGENLALACVSKGLLVIDQLGQFHFRHELARIATQARVPKHRHLNIHADILVAMQCLDDFDVSACIYHAAESLNAQAVFKFSVAAAEAASAQGAHKEAASYLATALNFVDEADTALAATLYENWAYESGLSQTISDDVIDARKLAVTLWRALKRADKVGENLRWLSRLYWYRGEASAANRYADEAIKTLESCPPSSERAMAYSLRSQLDMLNDRMDDAIRWGEKALAMEAQQTNIEVRAHALNNIGSAKAMRGNVDGKALLLESLKLSLDHQLHEHAARAYTNLGDFSLRYNDLAFGEEIIDEGIAFDTRHELDSWTYYLVGLQAQLRLKQGRLLDAESIAEGVIKLENQTKLMKLPARTVAAITKLRQGKPAFKAALDEALAVALNIGEVQYIIPLRFAQLESHFLIGDIEPAKDILNELNHFPSDNFDHWRAGELMLWNRRILGDETLTKHAGDLPSPIKHELNDQTQAAMDAWLSLGMPSQAALAAVSSRIAISEDQFDACSTLLDESALFGYSDLLERKAAQSGLSKTFTQRTRGPYKASRNHPAGLTAKEQQIFELLLQGKTNHQIAETLSRSRRTVENHVSAILSKLNAKSRMEAILRVQAEPWLAPSTPN